MKILLTIFLATLFTFALAQYDIRFRPDGRFQMTVIAFDYPALHYAYVGANNSRFIITSNSPNAGPILSSSCPAFIVSGTTSNCSESGGDVVPFMNGGNQTLLTYNENSALTQFAYIDVSGAAGGLFSYSEPGNAQSPSTLAHQFLRNVTNGIGELFWEQQRWVACPQQDTGKNTGAELYNIYAKASFGRKIKSDCVDIRIRTDTYKRPDAQCVYTTYN